MCSPMPDIDWDNAPQPCAKTIWIQGDPTPCENEAELGDVFCSAHTEAWGDYDAGDDER